LVKIDSLLGLRSIYKCSNRSKSDIKWDLTFQQMTSFFSIKATNLNKKPQLLTDHQRRNIKRQIY